MKSFPYSQSIKFFFMLTFSLGLISAKIQDKKCNKEKCSYVSKKEVKKKASKNTRPLFEKLTLI